MNKNRGSGLFLKLGVLVFAVYAVYTIVSLQLQIKDKKAEGTELRSAVEEQQLKNAEIESIIENSDDPEYIAKIARDKLGYISPGEKVFVNITD